MNGQNPKRESVRQVYSAIAESPQEEAPFPVGRALAENVGYPPELLDRMPRASVEGFCGVSNVSVSASIPEGSVVLDLGCGGGLDSLIAAERAGDSGKVIGVDYSVAMLERAARSVGEAQARNVELLQGDGESIPLESDSVDVALVNGIFNLNPDRDRIVADLARVLRPGSAACVAEIVLRAPLPETEIQDETDWFS